MNHLPNSGGSNIADPANDDSSNQYSRARLSTLADVTSPSSTYTTSTTTVKPQHTGGMGKEQLEISDQLHPQESVPVVEIKEPEKMPIEVEGWLEKLEKAEDFHLAQPLQHQGQTILEPTQKTVTHESIILPLTQEAFDSALHRKVSDSARWLAVWSLRLFKMFPEMVKFQKN